MTSLTIDGFKAEVEEGATILEAARRNRRRPYYQYVEERDNAANEESALI